MSYCPRAFNEDMTDPGNLAYCREIQKRSGDSCRKCRCGFYLGGEKVVAQEKVRSSRKTEQGGLF